MAKWKQLANDLAPLWPKGVSAVDAIREDRLRPDVYLARNDDLRSSLRASGSV